MKQKILLMLALWLASAWGAQAQSNALHFDGTDDYVACPAMNPTSFTVGAWVYPTALGKDQAIISTLIESSGSNTGLELHIGGNNIPLVTIRNGSSWLDVKGTSAVTVNTWTHVAATYNGVNLCIYVNGVLANSAAATQFTAGTQALYLGRRTTYMTRPLYFTGKIDEVSIWNKVLNEIEITTLMNSGLSGTEADLAAYYKFEQGAASGSNSGITTLTDRSANSKNGTLTNFALLGTASNWVEGYSFPIIEATPTSLSLTKLSGSYGEINITSNTSWTISGTADWLQLSATSGSGNGTITFTTLSENTNPTSRTATFSLIGAGVTEPITITASQTASSVPLTETISVTITKTDNTQTTVTEAASLQAAIGLMPLEEVKKLEITAGMVTGTDWQWLLSNKNTLNRLTHFTITDGVTEVSNNRGNFNSIFNNSIEHVNIWGITDIRWGEFKDCTSLLSVSFPTVVGISDWAFQGCTSLSSVSFPTASSIGNYAFYSCTSLNSINFPMVSSIGNYAFMYCSSLLTVSLPKATIIGDGAFQSCTSLRSVNFPLAQSIGAYALSYTSLSNIILGAVPPNNVGEGPFWANTAARSLSISNASGVDLTNAYAAYKAAPDGDTTDDFWYGCQIVNAGQHQTISTSAAFISGGHTLSPVGLMPSGIEIPLSVVPAVGYRMMPGSLVAYKTGDMNTSVTINNSTITMPTFDVTITATFELQPYSVFSDANMQNCTIIANPRAGITMGTEVTLSLYPASGYKYTAGTLKAYRTDNSTIELAITDLGNGTYTFIMPAHLVTVTAMFEQQIVWTGTTSNDWHTASNWSNNTVPSTEDVVIPVGLTNYPTISTDVANFNSLTLKSNATGTATLIALKGLGGNVNVEQYITGHTNLTSGNPNGRFWYLSSPVSDAKSDVFNAAAANNKLWPYLENEHNYVEITNNTTALEVGRGYCVRQGTTGSVVFKGTLNSGSTTINATYADDNHVKQGFNLVGNPYTAYIDWNSTSLSKTNLVEGYWVRGFNGTAMVFDTYISGVGTSLSGTPMNGKIAPMQAFWVKANGITSSLTISPLALTHSGQKLVKGGTVDERPILRLKVSNGTQADEAIVLFDEKATNSFDNQYDAPKLSNDDATIPEIYTLSGTREIVINSLKDVASNKEVALGFRTGKAGKFTIKASEIKNFSQAVSLILEDKLTGIKQNLSQTPEYTFSSEVATINNRFVLHFAESTTGIDEASETSNVNIWLGADNQLNVELGKADGKSRIQIYTPLGQQLLAKEFAGTQTQLTLNYQPGVYLVSVISGKQKTTRKIVIQ
jgi:hypothetical protein